MLNTKKKKHETDLNEKNTERKNNKRNGEVYLHDISVCNTNLLWRVSVSCFNAISVNRNPFWFCGLLIGYLKAKELI